MNTTEMTPELTALVTAARPLPPDLIRQVTEFAASLGKQHSANSRDESDEWTEEDMRDATIASLRRFEAEHPGDDWGTDYANPGGPGNG